MGLQILGIGHAVPKQVVTNDDLAMLVDTSDEWIVSRTGIHTRHLAKEESNTSLALTAAQEAIKQAGIHPRQIGVCIVATISPDQLIPAEACVLAGMLSLPSDAICFDLNAACSGFIYALSTAHALLASMPGKCALVIGTEVLSRLVDMADRNTCVLFGDGSGAVVVRQSDRHPFYFTGGCRSDETSLTCAIQNPVIKMDGKAVFRFAVEVVPECIEKVLQENNLTMDEIDAVVCHQANKRIIEGAIRRLNADPKKFFMNLQYYGNTSSASIPLALYELAAPPSTKVIAVGFGGGLTYGAALITL